MNVEPMTQHPRVEGGLGSGPMKATLILEATLFNLGIPNGKFLLLIDRPPIRGTAAQHLE